MVSHANVCNTTSDQSSVDHVSRRQGVLMNGGQLCYYVDSSIIDGYYILHAFISHQRLFYLVFFDLGGLNLFYVPYLSLLF